MGDLHTHQAADAKEATITKAFDSLQGGILERNRHQPVIDLEKISENFQPLIEMADRGELNRHQCALASALFSHAIQTAKDQSVNPAQVRLDEYKFLKGVREKFKISTDTPKFGNPNSHKSAKSCNKNECVEIIDSMIESGNSLGIMQYAHKIHNEGFKTLAARKKLEIATHFAETTKPYIRELALTILDDRLKVSSTFSAANLLDAAANYLDAIGEHSKAHALSQKDLNAIIIAPK